MVVNCLSCRHLTDHNRNISQNTFCTYYCIHCFYHDTILTASTLECCYGLFEFFKLLLRTLSCLVAHEHLQYIATDCSFYQTPTPTAAARNESKSGLIISIEKKKNGARKFRSFYSAQVFTAAYCVLILTKAVCQYSILSLSSNDLGVIIIYLRGYRYIMRYGETLRAAFTDLDAASQASLSLET